MIGPSAIGSENGNPISITSAPAVSSAPISSIVRSASGCPAVIYGTSARRPAARSSANRWSMRSSTPVSGEVVADANAIAIGILGFDDGSEERAFRVAIGEIDERTGKLQVALPVRHDANKRTREHVLQRIHRMHDAQLERVEDDERADRI